MQPPNACAGFGHEPISSNCSARHDATCTRNPKGEFWNALSDTCQTEGFEGPVVGGTPANLRWLNAACTDLDCYKVGRSAGETLVALLKLQDVDGAWKELGAVDLSQPVSPDVVSHLDADAYMGVEQQLSHRHPDSDA